MFAISTTNECPAIDRVPPASELNKPPSSRAKHKPKKFFEIVFALHEWVPSDEHATRKQLVSEVRSLLEEKKYGCAKACIPALVIEKDYPFELLHYGDKFDADELLVRMLWMCQEYGSAIGILMNVPSEHEAMMIKAEFDGLLGEEKDCIVMMPGIEDPGASD
ncbi:MAG TPA: hypothetical protein VMB46_08765 [Methanomassiliicoccales archaeon]|nr:hypothetical protein [Methanomassiliicoccales archaeon]